MAALQVALRTRGLYAGTIDGLRGPTTTRAVRVLQRQAGLAVDGIVGPATRRALGRHGRPQLGKRLLTVGVLGWDVAELQFLLAWHGFPSATIDGDFGTHLQSAVRRFQRWAGLPADGVAGPATLAALHRPLPRSPFSLSWPLAGPIASGFGPRGARFHEGIDIAASTGTPVGATRAGRVTFAAPAGSWGRLVIVAHGRWPALFSPTSRASA